MSTYVDKVEYIKGGHLTVPRAVYEALREDAPESSFYDDDGLEAPDLEDLDEPIDWSAYPDVVLEALSFSGSGSSRFYDRFVAELLPATKGSADILIAWEYGSLEGIRVTNGHVRHGTVAVALHVEGEDEGTPVAFPIADGDEE